MINMVIHHDLSQKIDKINSKKSLIWERNFKVVKCKQIKTKIETFRKN